MMAKKLMIVCTKSSPNCDMPLKVEKVSACHMIICYLKTTLQYTMPYRPQFMYYHIPRKGETESKS